MQPVERPAANLFTRDDTFFGICEGLGQDTGIPANLIRIALAGLCFFYPLPTIAAYLGLGLVVFATRFFFPDVHAYDVVDEPAAKIDAAKATDSADLPLAA